MSLTDRACTVQRRCESLAESKHQGRLGNGLGFECTPSVWKWFCRKHSQKKITKVEVMGFWEWKEAKQECSNINPTEHNLGLVLRDRSLGQERSYLRTVPTGSTGTGLLILLDVSHWSRVKYPWGHFQLFLWTDKARASSQRQSSSKEMQLLLLGIKAHPPPEEQKWWRKPRSMGGALTASPMPTSN